VLKHKLVRGLGAGLAAIVASAGVSVLAATPALAAPIGSLSVSPANGTDITPNINFTSSAACPAEATNVYVSISGAGFPAGSNAVGNADIGIYSTTPAGGLVVPLGQTWGDLARSAGAPLPLSGTATLTLVCTDLFASANLGDFPAQVTFTPATGTSFSYAQMVAGPQATTTTLTASPANPSPTDTVTLTATVSPAAAAGSVQFRNGTSNLGAAVTVSGGTATFSGTFTEGSHSLSAVFTPSNPTAYQSSTGTRTLVVTVTPPNSVTQTITTSVPLTGALTISVANNQVNLPQLTLNPAGTLLSTSGNINNTTVTDTRNSNPGWNVTGQTTDFSGTPAGTINGHNLGWTPAVVSSSTGQTVTAGPAVPPAPGIAPGASPPDPGQGIKTSRTLASAAAGSGAGTAVLNANLALNAPTNTPPGTYSATLTLTAI
jgi:Bacterial Ig-like domain (group 3)